MSTCRSDALKGLKLGERWRMTSFRNSDKCGFLSLLRQKNCDGASRRSNTRKSVAKAKGHPPITTHHLGPDPSRPNASVAVKASTTAARAFLHPLPAHINSMISALRAAGIPGLSCLEREPPQRAASLAGRS